MIIIAILALILAFLVYIPIAIANLKPRIPEYLRDTRGIDTQEKYREYLDYNKQFK